jgi:hypothetical protein
LTEWSTRIHRLSTSISWLLTLIKGEGTFNFYHSPCLYGFFYISLVWADNPSPFHLAYFGLNSFAVVTFLRSSNPDYNNCVMSSKLFNCRYSHTKSDRTRLDMRMGTIEHCGSTSSGFLSSTVTLNTLVDVKYVRWREVKYLIPINLIATSIRKMPRKGIFHKHPMVGNFVV